MLDALTPQLRGELLQQFCNDAFQFDNVAAEAEARVFMQQKLAEIKRKAIIGTGIVAAGALLAWCLLKK